MVLPIFPIFSRESFRFQVVSMCGSLLGGILDQVFCVFFVGIQAVWVLLRMFLLHVHRTPHVLDKSSAHEKTAGKNINIHINMSKTSVSPWCPQPKTTIKGPRSQ